MINGRSYYHFKLRRRTVGPGEKFDIASFLAFFSGKVLRGRPRALVQLTTCFAVLILLLRILPHRVADGHYSEWSWGNAQDGDDARESVVDDDDGSVPGGLRIVVFGENDVATPARLGRRGTENVAGPSWTELLCEELDCSSYLSFVPTSGDPSRVMASTKLYASSVDRALNLTFENDGPGWDYNFMLDQFPIEWKVNDLSKQVDRFLSMKKPKHSPAETVWVLSFGMWDIWSLASEPISVSKTVIGSVVDHIFLEIERLYASAMNETSIAWSEPEPVPQTTSTVSDGLPTPTPDPETAGPWIKERDPSEEGSAAKADNKTEEESLPDRTKHFRILVPKLFDPSLTPGWHDARPKIPPVHSNAEQMRNAAMLTEEWNNEMWSAMAEWIRSEGRRGTGAETPRKAAPPAIGGKTAVQIINEKVSASRAKKVHLSARAAVVGGQNHISPPPPAQEGNADVENEPKQQDDGTDDSVVTADPDPVQPQRDGILYELNIYLEEVIVQRQLQKWGLRDARRGGKLTEEGFQEVSTPCIGQLSNVRMGDEMNTIDSSGEADGAYQRKRSVESRIPDPAPTSVADTPDFQSPVSTEITICENPDAHLFYTPFTVSPRAVAVIARQAADMVRKNETMRSRWASIQLPPLKYVG